MDVDVGEWYTLTAIVVESRLFLSHWEGSREVDTAEQLFRDIERKRKQGHPLPLVISDDWHPFEEALCRVYQPRLNRGRQKRQQAAPSRQDLSTSIHYAQVCKHRQGYHIVATSPKIVFGDEVTILSTVQRSGGRVVNTAYAERLNLTIRNSLARFVRKGQNFSKKTFIHTLVLDFFQAWYNFVKPHRSLRQKIDHPRRKWCPRTPAMAAGITDKIWSLEDLLTFRIPVQL